MFERGTSAEDPSVCATTLTSTLEGLTKEDPTVTFDWSKKSTDFKVVEMWKESVWIGSWRYFVIRSLLVLNDIGVIINVLVQVIMMNIDPRWSSTQAWIDYEFVDDLIFQLSYALLPLHTLLVSRLGFDKMYFLHLFLHGISRLSYTIRVCAVKTPTDWTLYNYFEIAASLTYCFTYFFWNFKTRLLYLRTYRNAWKFFRVKEAALFNRLIVPWSLLFASHVLIFLSEKICFKVLTVETESQTQLAFEISTYFFCWACLLYFEIYMYVALNPNKGHWYLFSFRKTRRIEKLYICITLCHMLISFFNLVLAVNTLYSNNLDPDTFYYLNLIFLFYQEIVINGRNIVLWHHAVSVLKKELIRMCAIHTRKIPIIAS